MNCLFDRRIIGLLFVFLIANTYAQMKNLKIVPQKDFSANEFIENDKKQELLVTTNFRDYFNKNVVYWKRTFIRNYVLFFAEISKQPENNFYELFRFDTTSLKLTKLSNEFKAKVHSNYFYFYNGKIVTIFKSIVEDVVKSGIVFIECKNITISKQDVFYNEWSGLINQDDNFLYYITRLVSVYRDPWYYILFFTRGRPDKWRLEFQPFYKIYKYNKLLELVSEEKITEAEYDLRFKINKRNTN